MRRRVWLTLEEEQGYYYGFANEGLWPLCHVAPTRPTFRAEDWRHYQAVNRKLADAVCDEVGSEDAIILVQDYHFALAPRMIRERLRRATLLSFLAYPVAESGTHRHLPLERRAHRWAARASIVGFHTLQQLSRFTGAACELTEALIVNPYDLEQASSALLAAVRMPPEEQRERTRALRRLVAEFNVYRWAGRMLRGAADLRRRERLSGRLARPARPSTVELAPFE